MEMRFLVWDICLKRVGCDPQKAAVQESINCG